MLGTIESGAQIWYRSDDVLCPTSVVPFNSRFTPWGIVFLTSPSSVAGEELALGVLAESPCQGGSQNTVE